MLHGLFAGDAQDVVRDERAVDEGVAGLDEVAGVDAQVLAVAERGVRFSMPLSLRTMMVRLPRRFSPTNFDRAGDFGHDGRVLGLAGFENFGDAGQTAGDVLRAARLRAGVWPSSVPAEICWPSLTSMWALSGR